MPRIGDLSMPPSSSGLFTDEAQGPIVVVARRVDQRQRQVEGRTPCYEAAVLANGDAVLRLLLERAPIRVWRHWSAQTPLMAAAVRGDTDAMQLLIGKGADVNTKNGAGETALILAAANGNPRVVQLLLEKGADATVKTKRSETALGNAATTGVEETVKLLLGHGADINVRNIRGYSPLMLAASSDVMPAGVVKMLLAAGADTSYSADYDETALDLAAKRGDTEVARLLGGSRTTRTERSDASAPSEVRHLYRRGFRVG